ncbi:hypothetical protein [Turicimonas muris]|uniref:hypothetical protein n=1 Tax=Turicimonas muris TaxID=1796652 RepID=UPI002632B6AE|nr:hypothetical protein [Turicimonas muris]
MKQTCYKSALFFKRQRFHIRSARYFTEYRLKLLQLQQVDGQTKERLFAAVVVIGEEYIQDSRLLHLLRVIDFHTGLPGPI